MAELLNNFMQSFFFKFRGRHKQVCRNGGASPLSKVMDVKVVHTQLQDQPFFVSVRFATGSSESILRRHQRGTDDRR